jgi:predicted RNA-binding Zn ribbon-like protein
MSHHHMKGLELIRDFVNTADLERGDDALANPRGLQSFLALHALAEPRDRATAGDLAEARAIREAVRDLLGAHTGADVDRDAASATLDRASRKAGLAVRFDGGVVHFRAGGQGISGGLGRLLAAVAEAMADGSWQRLKACRSDSCRWAFIDNARNHSRLWCDMATCGNRAKARAFRSRSA